MALESTGFRFLLGFVFFLASVPKLAAPTDFALAVENYRLVPARTARIVARLLPPAELLCALSLLSGTAASAMALAAALMLAAFALAVSTNLLRGRAIDCGCAGTASPRRIGWTLVARDMTLAALALVVFVAPSGPNLWRLPHGIISESVNDGDAVALALSAAIAAIVEGLVVDLLRLRAAVSGFSRAPAHGARP